MKRLFLGTMAFAGAITIALQHFSNWPGHAKSPAAESLQTNKIHLYLIEFIESLEPKGIKGEKEREREDHLT